jgi:hypothetical protein
MPDRSRTFTTVVTTDSRGRVMVPLGFDPDAVWGTKTAHRVHGTVNGMGVRAERIAEMVGLLEAGRKERPSG